MKVTIIGAGNVSWHLSQALEDAGHSIQEVYSKNIKNAEKLCSRLYDAFPSKDLDFEQSEAEVFLIAVSDDAIDKVTANLIVPPGSVVAHTSGTKSLEALELIFEHCGVFYPLQTFSKTRKVDLSEVPLCIESSDEKAKKTLTVLAKSITSNIQYLNSQKRKVLHLAAVFSCNFTNHLLALSKEILNDHSLDYGMLNALISETINKALESDPKSVQTGPAVRRDVKTIQEHLKFLNDDPDKKQIYKILSESILKMAKQEK